MGVLYYFLLLIPFSFTIIVSVVYFYFISSYNYWRKRGIPYVMPTFPFGNLGEVLRGKKSLMDLTIENYRKFEGERYFGMFNFNKPVLVLRDPAIIERVLITDFTIFGSKQSGPCKDDVLSFYLGNLQGEEWRQMRLKLNGAFSKMKLKQMTEHILKCGDCLIKTVEDYKEKQGVINASCLGYAYSQRVIAGCAFGIEHDCVGMKTFVSNVKKQIFNMKVVHLILLWQTFAPRCMRLLYAIPQVAQVVDYFKNLTLATIQVRKEFHTKRNDFLQMLIDLREEEDDDAEINSNNFHDLKSEDIPNKNKCQIKKPSIHLNQLLTDHCITSNIFIFMSLGIELTSVVISYLLYYLAANPKAQQKVQKEVDEVYKKFGVFNCEALQQLTYLDLVIQECVRIKTATNNISRVCQSDYKIPGSDLVLEKGTEVVIPVCAIHLDPQHFSDPESFDPDRFIDNHYKSCSTYFPFGMGPRSCIALKLVVVLLKIAMAKVFLKYTITLSEPDQPPQYTPKFMPHLYNGPYIDFQPRPTH